MYTAAIDGHALNGLFDNQKKLDELFDSIFDDDNYFINSTSSSLSSTQSSYAAYDKGGRFESRHGRVTESLAMMKHQSPYFIFLPIVLEITAIYFIVTNLL
ncbi:MAG: hypothetical protein CTY19_16325 [Methylomonas sp.]|jgi:hypothetical protein|nr:MAG: hypothetical protein CTY19_16325 [Methylomonas sp.]